MNKSIDEEPENPGSVSSLNRVLEDAWAPHTGQQSKIFLQEANT